MGNQRTGCHTVSRFTTHIVWVTKYRYPVLTGDIKIRCRSILLQIREAEDVQILKGVVSKDHIHIHIEYRSVQFLSTLLKLLKRSFFEKVTDGISRITEALLGSSFLGNRIWLLEYR